MKIQRVLIAINIALTTVTMVLLAFLLARAKTVSAQGVASVLRGRALEIVDDRGRVRASITVIPGDPKFKMPDGRTGYPESVLLRMISPKGRPNIKIGASDEGAGVGIGGESDPTYVQIIAEGTSTALKLTNKDGRQQVIKP
jgi:hypothetical protein